MKLYEIWGWGIGDGGWGMGDWGLGPIPNPQSPIPNPQSPFKVKLLIQNNIINFIKIFHIISYNFIDNK